MKRQIQQSIAILPACIGLLVLGVAGITLAADDDSLDRLASAELTEVTHDLMSVKGDGCDCASACECGLGGKLNQILGFVKPSDSCFNDFISPMTNPVFFEEPRTVTEAEALFLHHTVPLAAGGHSIQLYAVRLKAALSERLSFVAAKAWFITSSNPLADDGWADTAVGLKYNLVRDPCAQRILSAGFNFEFPWGSQRTLQGRGDGELHLYLTGAQKLNDCWNWMSATAFRLPMNTARGSQMFSWSNHVDYRLSQKCYLLAECNWYHWMRAGKIGFPGIEGGDLFNFGSPGVAGNDIVTSAVGLKIKPTDLMEVGLALEFPLTERRDVLDNRLTANWIFRY